MRRLRNTDSRTEQESAILKAEGLRQATLLEAEGQAGAIATIFKAIHDGKVDPKLLAYQYLQVLPQIAQGDANKLWIVPSELGEALKGIGGMLGRTVPDVPPAAPRHHRGGEDDHGK